MRDTLGKKISASWRILGNVSSRGDVISGDGVTKVTQNISSFDVLNGTEFQFEGLEEGRIVDV